MFLQASVILSTGGVSRPIPRRRLGIWLEAGVVSRPRPRGDVRPTPGGRVSRSGGCIPAYTEADTPADGYCCGRYGSYWNAFLFLDFCLPAGNVFFNLEFVLFVFKKKLGMWNSGRPLATDIGPINGHRKWTAPSNGQRNSQPLATDNKRVDPSMDKDRVIPSNGNRQDGAQQRTYLV